MSKATDKQWRVQTKAKNGAWVNRGLFETRDAARTMAKFYRECHYNLSANSLGFGFGNTRVIPYMKAVK